MFLSVMIPMMSYAALLMGATDAPAKDVSVTVVKIAESRERKLAEGEDRFADRNDLRLTINVAGKAVEKAGSYGQVKWAEAVDDTGKDLKPKEKKGFFGGNDDGFTQINSGMSGMLQAKGEKGFRMEITLESSARKASKIRSLKGEFQVLAGGKEATVTVKGLAAMLGKAVSDPQLKAAGVEITILDPKKPAAGGGGMLGGGDNSFPLELKGNITAIKEIKLLDKSGKSASDSSMSMGGEGKQTRTYELKKPLDDTITLKIELVSGQKAVTVPFEFKGVELP